MDDPIAMLGIFRDYHGNCDRCGEEISEPVLLVSDMHTTDKYGNRLYLVIGSPEEYYIHGQHMSCKKCGGRPIVLCLYKSTDVTEVGTKNEARNAL